MTGPGQPYPINGMWRRDLQKLRRAKTMRRPLQTVSIDMIDKCKQN